MFSWLILSSITGNSTIGEDADAPRRYPTFRATFGITDENLHQAIFVRTSTVERGGGQLFHVNGWMGAPLVFVVDKNSKHPFEISMTCLYIQQIGWVSRGNLDEMESVCRAIRPTERQWDGVRDIIGARSNPDWVTDAIEALRLVGIIEPLGVDDNDDRVYP
jgi:hypothetical protein